jgi:hypothetical protein
MFVPLTRTNYLLDESSESWDGVISTGVNGTNRTVGVRWAESDIFVGKTRENRSLSSVSPGNGRFESTIDSETSFGARRVTWGSSVGSGDRGVLETPEFFVAVPTQ